MILWSFLSLKSLPLRDIFHDNTKQRIPFPFPTPRNITYPTILHLRLPPLLSAILNLTDLFPLIDLPITQMREWQVLATGGGGHRPDSSTFDYSESTLTPESIIEQPKAAAAAAAAAAKDRNAYVE